MTGCDSCSKNLEAEVRQKDPDDLTESEKKLLEEGADAAVPKFMGIEVYGPLSSWDGDYCEFCHGIGQFGGLVFAGGAFLVGLDLFGLGPAVLAGFIVWLLLALSIGFFGRFPVLGALFGPIVEKIAAKQFGVYLTEKARDDYAPTQQGALNKGNAEYRMPLDGPEMHLLATPWALETCADMGADGAVVRAEIENGDIVDIHPWEPEFNRFPNIIDHVGYRQFNNVCQAQKQQDGPVTVLSFQELLQTQGEEGIK